MLPLLYVAYQHFIWFFEVGLHIIGGDIAKGGRGQNPHLQSRRVYGAQSPIKDTVNKLRLGRLWLASLIITELRTPRLG